MVRIDDDFMREVGLEQMPAAEKQAFMEHAQEEFEVRVGQSVGAYLTDEQIEEFERIEEPTQAAAWLDQYVPNFREIVKVVYQNFQQELIAERERILR